MTCRDELLKAAESIIKQKGKNEFSLEEILKKMIEMKSEYQESTIRTHVTSRMCRNAPQHHAVKYDDFERIGFGVYRVVRG